MKRIVYFVIGIMLVLGVAGFLGRDSRSAGSSSSPAGEGELVVETVKGDLVIHVEAAGEILAVESVKVIPQIKRKAVLSYIVDEGTKVQVGDVLARFDPEPIQQLIDTTTERLDDEELQKIQDEAAVDIQRMEGSNSVKSAQTNLKNNKLELEKFIKADKPLNERTVELALKTAESDLSRATQRHKELKELFDQGFITQAEVEEAQITEEQAQVALESARIDKRTMHEYVLPVKETELNNKINASAVNLQKAETLARTNKLRTERTLQKTLIDIHEAEELLAKLNSELTNLVVVAPAAGVVVYGDPDRGRYRNSDMRAGESIYPATVLMTIPVVAEMKASVDISEADIEHLQAGQSATIRVDALNGRAYRGQVKKVAEFANNNGYFSTGVKEFSAILELHEHEGLKPGYSCHVEILTQTIPDALMLPVQAVYKEGEAYLVYLPDGSERAVKVGPHSATHVQIIKGLVPGEKVRLLRPVSEES